MSDWISVKDRLPKDKRPIEVIYAGRESRKILCAIGGEIFVCTFTNADCFMRLATDIYFSSRDQKWWIPKYYKSPTHWMEIPELPGDICKSN